jgi:hypothetical protein
MIYKTKMGLTIDLDKIIGITDAGLIKVESFECTVGFTIFLQGSDKPIIFKRPLYPSEYEKERRGLLLKDGNYISLREFTQQTKYLLSDKNIAAVDNLQEQVNDLILVWNEYKRGIFKNQFIRRPQEDSL